MSGTSSARLDPNEERRNKILRYWDVTAPSPNNSVKGQLMKGALKKIGKQRRISLETHCIRLTDVDLKASFRRNGKKIHHDQKFHDADEKYFEKSFLRISKLAKPHMLKKGPKKPGQLQFDHHVSHCNRNFHGEDEYDHNDDSSIGSMMSNISLDEQSLVSFPGTAQNAQTTFLPPLSTIDEDQSRVMVVGGPPQERAERPNKETWITKHKIPLSSIVLSGTEKNKISMTITNENTQKIKEIRKIHFTSSEEAQDFYYHCSQKKEGDERREVENLKKATEGLVIEDDEMDEKINFLIDIVGAEKLAVSDITSSDPFVVVKFKNIEIHQTKYVSNNLNPIWTLRQRSLFVFSVTPRELFLVPEGINFVLYDFDLNGNDFLGQTSIPSRTLFLANEERMEFELKPLMIGGESYPKVPKNKPYLGTISIRCRRATEYDLDFMQKFKNDDMNLVGLNAPDEKLRQSLGQGIMLKHNKKVFKNENEKVTKYKLRPGPNPKNPTVHWMTATEIEEEVMKESHSFRSYGVYDIARVHIEILKCDGLPQMDHFAVLGNKTDAFVQIIYEDYCCETSTIMDTNSPRWMPWTNRAFTLNTKYPSSMLYIGVHDYDPGAAMMVSHDLIGRCAVDVTNLKPDTEYLLEYNLYNTAMKIKRESFGTIKFRLRIEIDDPRAFLLAALKPIPPVYVNTTSKKKFSCIHKTVHGDFDESKYSLKTTLELFLEIIQQKRVIYYIKHIVESSLFWRPSKEIKVRVPFFLSPHTDDDTGGNGSSRNRKTLLERYTVEKEYSIPLNSIVIFVATAFVVEYPHFFPSFACFCMGGCLILTGNFKQSYANPWWKCNTFMELFLVLILGKNAKRSPETIVVNQSINEAKEADLYWEQLIETEEKEAMRRRMEIAEEQVQLEKDLIEAKGDSEDIATKVAQMKIDPAIILKPYLYPIQQSLVTICFLIRRVKNIILWEESLYSFLIAFTAFTLSFLFLFLPWIFIFRWSARILVWGLLGPWMMLLDPTRKKEEVDQVEIDAIMRMKRKVKREETLVQARIQNELTRKYRDFKMFFFGKYLTKVPILRVDRYLDLPLPSSFAKPYVKRQMTFGDVAIEEAAGDNAEVGQQLVGLMIPKIRDIPRVVVPRGQLTRGDGGNDSVIFAYTKIGTMAMIAAVVSYVAVPLMAKILSYASHLERMKI